MAESQMSASQGPSHKSSYDDILFCVLRGNHAYQRNQTKDFPGQYFVLFRHRLNGYFAHRVPSLFLASSSRKCSN